MGLFNRLFGNEKKSTPAIPENKTGQEEQTPLYDPLAPQNNFQAMAKIRELNGYDNSTVKIVARLIKVAVEYWQIRLAQYFRSELGTNELRIVLGLLGSKCLIAPSTPCGKTTGIGIAALARYILLRDLKQIWIMPHGELASLVSGQEHSILRDFLDEYGVQFLDTSRLLEFGSTSLPSVHKYANIIPVFEGRLPSNDYQIRDYWRGIDVVYLDNVFISASDLERFSPTCSILAMADENKARILGQELFQGRAIFSKWETAF